MDEIVVLTPVPLEHLESGLETCRARGLVAFGSQAFEFFERLDDEIGVGATILIYASHSDTSGPPAVTWEATFVEYLRSEQDPRRLRRLRPGSCREEDKAGYWAGYYVVAHLERLDEPVPIDSLSGVEGKRFARSFRPEGPLLASRG